MRKGFYLRLALDGMRKNKRLYLPYLLTCAGMVMMFYILCSLAYSPVVRGMRGGETMTIVLLLAAIVAALVYTALYIRRIKRQRHETLQAYLTLLEEKDRRVAVPAAPVPRVKTDDPMLERIMTFIEENIGNGEAGVGDMAAAAATSRSGLQRKLKQAMGITPQDLLREARIKHACQLLRQTDKTVAEVAYSCGFSDPKYFSRCFKQSTGCAPSEYRSAGES